MANKNILLLLIALVTVLGGCGREASDDLVVEAFVDERSVADGSVGSPIRIETQTEGELRLDISNPTSETVNLEHIRMEGEVLSMTFMSYGTSIETSIPPGSNQTIIIPLDFFDLDRQANGYLQAAVRTYDDQKVRRSTNGFPADVRGRTWSTMGFFAFALFVLTALSLLFNIRGIARRTLPPNRFQRGLRFLASGLGIGLLLAVGLAVLRVMSLPTAGWLPLVALPAIASFALGYLSPGALGDDLEDEWDKELLEEEMAEAAEK